MSRQRNPKSAREESRWRADGNSIEATCRHFNVSIVPSPGLGLRLGELILGSDDEAYPLVVVDGLVEGGAAAQQAKEAPIGQCAMEGDTLITVHSASGFSIDVEASTYDYTVEAISAALASAPGEPITLTLGRIVRRGRAVVTAVLPSGEETRFVCYEGENLRMALLRRGLRLNDMTANRYDNKAKGSGDCGGNGLCATCVVGVLQGGENLTPRGASEQNLLRRVARWRQSCRAYVQCPEGLTDVEVKIQVSPRGGRKDGES